MGRWEGGRLLLWLLFVCLFVCVTMIYIISDLLVAIPTRLISPCFRGDRG